MALGTAVIAQLFEVGDASVVVTREQNHQRNFAPVPNLCGVVLPTEPAHPDAEGIGRNHRGVGDAAQQLALHDFEAFAADLVFTHAVIDKQSR